MGLYGVDEKGNLVEKGSTDHKGDEALLELKPELNVANKGLYDVHMFKLKNKSLIKS